MSKINKKNDLKIFKTSNPVHSGKIMKGHAPFLGSVGGAREAEDGGFLLLSDDEDETSEAERELEDDELDDEVDDEVDDELDDEITVATSIYVESPSHIPTTTAIKKVAPAHINIDDDPYIFLKKMETSGGLETRARLFDPLEVKVIKDLFLTPRLKFKSMEFYDSLLNQNQLRLAYVPDRASTHLPRLRFNQEWLQAVVAKSVPLDPVITSKTGEIRLMDDNFWSRLLDYNKEPLAADKLPISSEEIRKFDRGFAESSGNNSVVAERNINLIRPYVVPGSYKSKSAKSKASKKLAKSAKNAPNLKKIQDRVLGPLGKIVLGSTDLYQIVYEPVSAILGKSSDAENSQDFTHVELISMANQPILEGEVAGLIIMDNRIVSSDKGIPIKPSIPGERIALEKYYKLPIGFEPVSFYSNFLLTRKNSTLNSEIKNTIGKHAQTEIREGQFDVTSPEGFSKIMGVFRDLVLNPSAYIDLIQINGLLKYFNLDLKYLNDRDLKELAILMADHMTESTFKQIATFKDLYDKHIKALRSPISIVGNFYPLLKTPIRAQAELIPEMPVDEILRVDEVSELPDAAAPEDAPEDAPEEKAQPKPMPEDEDEDEAEDEDEDEAEDEEKATSPKKDTSPEAPEPKRRPDYNSKYELSYPLGIPLKLVWRAHLDQNSQAKFIFLDRLKQHYNSLPAKLNEVPLETVPDTTTIPVTDIPKEYAGLFINFPKQVAGPEAVATGLIWTKDGYLPREYYLAIQKQSANQRRDKINRRMAENTNIRETGLARIDQTITLLNTEIQYFDFQASLVSADPRSLLHRLFKLRVQRSPELVRLAQIVNNLPEFRRISYLLGALSKYKLDKKRYWIVDENGQNICCYHVPYWFEYGREATIEAFQANDLNRNENVCKYCGVDLESIKFDTSEDYIDGYVENTHDVVFRKDTELDKLMTKKYELIAYLKTRFITNIEPVVGIQLDDQARYKLYEQFILKIMGSLNPGDQLVFPNAWTLLGLRGKKWQLSNFIRPDVEIFQYLKPVSKLGKAWEKVFSPKKSKMDALRTSNPKVYVLTIGKLFKHYGEFYLANLIHVARQAIATILLAQNSESLTGPAKFKRLRSEVALLLKANYNPLRPPAPSLELKDQVLNQQDIDVIYERLPLPLLASVVNMETGGLKTEAFVEEFSAFTGSKADEYWIENYQALVDVYLKFLPIVESSEISLRETTTTTGLIFSRILEKEPSPANPTNPVYCHYLQQLKFQTLAQFYIELNNLIDRARVFTSGYEIHKCYGVRGDSRRSDYYCPTEDRFYYITRLVRGELSVNNLKRLNQVIDNYENSQQLAEFHQAFLELVENAKTGIAEKAIAERDERAERADSEEEDEEKAKPERAKSAEEKAEVAVAKEAIADETIAEVAIADKAIARASDVEVVEKIIQLAEKYQALRKDTKACLSQNSQIKLIDQIHKGNSRLMPPVEWPLKYKFLENWVPKKSKRLVFPKIKPVPEWAESLFNEMVTKANDDTNKILDNKRADLEKIFKLAIEWVHTSNKYQDHVLAVEGQLEVKTFFNYLGESNRLARSDPRRPVVFKKPPETGASDSKRIDQFNAWKEDSIKWQNRARPEPFNLWWHSEHPEYSRQEALTKWLNLSEETTDYWKTLARTSPIGYNQCLLEATQSTNDDYAWDTINKLLGYLEILRLYQIMFKNILNQDEKDEEVNSPIWPYMMVVEDKKSTEINKYPEWPIEWKKLLKDAKRDQVAGKLKGSFKQTPKQTSRPNSVEIVDFPQSNRERNAAQSKHRLILETTKVQLNAMIDWIITQQETAPELGTAPLLSGAIWDMIDCIDVEPSAQNPTDATTKDEKLAKMISIIKWVLLNDSLTNYETNKKFNDGNHYEELLKKIWLLIAQLDTSSNTSSIEIDYAIKYYFYSLYNDFKKSKEDRKNALKNKGKDVPIYNEAEEAEAQAELLEDFDEVGNVIEADEDDALDDPGAEDDAEGAFETAAEFGIDNIDGEDGGVDLAD